jgi:hypothetical protein
MLIPAAEQIAHTWSLCAAGAILLPFVVPALAYAIAGKNIALVGFATLSSAFAGVVGFFWAMR